MSNLHDEIELLDAPWESQEGDAPLLTHTQQAELEYRVAKYRQDPINVIAWEQVRALLSKKP